LAEDKKGRAIRVKESRSTSRHGHEKKKKKSHISAGEIQKVERGSGTVKSGPSNTLLKLWPTERRGHFPKQTS